MVVSFASTTAIWTGFAFVLCCIIGVQALRVWWHASARVKARKAEREKKDLETTSSLSDETTTASSSTRSGMLLEEEKALPSANSGSVIESEAESVYSKQKAAAELAKFRSIDEDPLLLPPAHNHPAKEPVVLLEKPAEDVYTRDADNEISTAYTAESNDQYEMPRHQPPLLASMDTLHTHTASPVASPASVRTDAVAATGGIFADVGRNVSTDAAPSSESSVVSDHAIYVADSSSSTVSSELGETLKIR
ncbi:hypothetical protein DIPPA_18280 [Diplonema papillatum]|nr:hypothetical protein DIPPA_18280 [Diplonema papillatum]